MSTNQRKKSTSGTATAGADHRPGIAQRTATRPARRTRPGAVGQLTDVVARLAAATTLERVTDTVTTAVRELLGADGATFVLREEAGCFYVDEDAVSPLWKGQRFPADRCLSGWVMQHGRMAVIEDVSADDRIPHDAYRPTFVRAVAMAPVRAEDPIAAIGAYWARHHRSPSRERAVLSALADAAAVALANLELRAQLRHQMSELAEVVSRRESVETAIHSIVHDLRSPMFAIDTYATLLASGDIGGESICEIAEKMRASVEGMSHRIDGLLTLYRLDHQPVVPQPVDLTALATTVAREVRHRTGAYDVDLRVDRDLRVTMDPVLGRLMIENLLDNAYKFTAQREEPLVEVRRDIAVSPAGDPGMVWVVVADNGVGFDPEHAARLFTARTRLDTAAAFSGTGLGLASVARIVELHGGLIRATGTSGGGAAFHLCLPRA